MAKHILQSINASFQKSFGGQKYCCQRSRLQTRSNANLHKIPKHDVWLERPLMQSADTDCIILVLAQLQKADDGMHTNVPRLAPSHYPLHRLRVQDIPMTPSYPKLNWRLLWTALLGFATGVNKSNSYSEPTAVLEGIVIGWFSQHSPWSLQIGAFFHTSIR